MSELAEELRRIGQRGRLLCSGTTTDKIGTHRWTTYVNGPASTITLAWSDREMIIRIPGINTEETP